MQESRYLCLRVLGLAVFFVPLQRKTREKRSVMLEKLEAINEKFLEIEQQMNDPEVMNDMKHYVKISKDYKDLQPIIAAYKEYKNVLEN